MDDLILITNYGIDICTMDKLLTSYSLGIINTKVMYINHEYPVK